MKTSTNAVATSWRPRRPSVPIPSAPSSAKAPRPMIVLTPTSAAPAAPAKEPFGIACAANDEPRSTTKKPTSPDTIATTVATIQALTMNPSNIAESRPRSRRATPPSTAAVAEPAQSVGKT